MMDVNPQQALKMIVQNNWSTELFNMTDKWTSKNPLSFLECIKENLNDENNSNKDTRSFLKLKYGDVFAKIWEYDQEQTFEEILKLNEAKDQEIALNGISSTMEDNQDFIDLAKEINNNNLSPAAIIRPWVIKHPEEAMTWALQNKDKLPSTKLDDAIRVWLFCDMNKASEWILNVAQNKKKALHSIVDRINPRNAGDIKWFENYLEKDTSLTKEEKKEITQAISKRQIYTNFLKVPRTTLSELIDGELN